MSSWVVVLCVVCAGTLLIGGWVYLRSDPPLRSVGRRAQAWLEHPEDRRLEERPNEDDREPEIPRRPLRGRGNA